MQLAVHLHEERFVRLQIENNYLPQKIELINDVPAHTAGICPPDLARVLCSVTEDDWRVVKWIEPPSVTDYLESMKKLAEKLVI